MSNGGVTIEGKTSPLNKQEKRRRIRDETSTNGNSSSSSPDDAKEPLKRKAKVNHNHSEQIEEDDDDNPRLDEEDAATTHQVLPSVNLYTALRDLKSNDVNPEDYAQPLERSIFAVKAASNVRDLLKARHETLMVRRLALQIASPNTSADDEQSEQISKSRKTSGEEEEEEVSVIIDDSSTVATITRRSKRSRQEKSAFNPPTAFDSSGETQESSYMSYYRAPLITDMPWYRFLFHKQAGYEEYVRQRAHHKTGRAKLEWDASTDQQIPPTSKVMELYTSLSFFERLHEEVIAFITWAEMTSWEEQKRMEILARIELVASTLWPHSRTIPFGSFYTGLTLPHGDIDICIVNVPDYKRPADLILELSKALRKCRCARNLVAITRARIPIVKFIDDSSNIQVDISVNQPSATETSDLTREKLAGIPLLRPLIMTIKKLLDQLDLNETYQGGIGSYMLFTMCLAHIQAELRSKGPKFIREANLGCLVYGFLERYTGFNYYFNGIDVRGEGRFFDKRELTNERDCPQPLLCIKSPLEPETDVGKNSYKFPEVIDRFKWRLDRLDSILDVEMKFEKSNDLKSLYQIRKASVLATVIRPDDKLFSNRELSTHHPDQKAFSVFNSRAIPKVSRHLQSIVRREMETVIAKLTRSMIDTFDIDRSLHASAMVRAHSAFSPSQHRSRYSSYSQHRYEDDTNRYEENNSYRQYKGNTANRKEIQADYKRKVVVVEDETANVLKTRNSSYHRRLVEEEDGLSNVSNVPTRTGSTRGRRTNIAVNIVDDEDQKINDDGDDDISIIPPPPPPRGLPPRLPAHHNRNKQDNFAQYLRKPQAIHMVERWN